MTDQPQPDTTMTIKHDHRGSNDPINHEYGEPDELTQEYEELDSMIKVAIDGDLILYAGVDEVAILVSSHCFKLASKPFDAIIQTAFSAYPSSSETSSRRAVELKLPEDDSEALTLLCQILHFQAPALDKHNLQDNALHLTRLLRLAIKYECVNAVRFYVASVSRTATSSQPSMLGVAYLLDDHQLFKKVSQQIIIKENPLDAAVHAEFDPGTVLPAEVWLHLVQRQRKLWSYINKKITLFRANTTSKDDPLRLSDFSTDAMSNGGHMITPLQTVTAAGAVRAKPSANFKDGCSHCATMRPFILMAFFNDLASSDLWPLPVDISIEVLLQKLEHTLVKSPPKHYRTSAGVSYIPAPRCPCSVETLGGLVVAIRQSIESTEEGLCIDCLIPGRQDKVCRVGHVRHMVASSPTAAPPIYPAHSHINK